MTASSSCKRSFPLHATTGLSYDACAYAQELDQSTGPGRYVIGTPTHASCVECSPADPRLVMSHGGNSKCANVPLIDVDSELQGLNRRATKCPSNKYQYGASGNTCELRHVPACNDPAMISEDTLLSNPPCNLRGVDNGFNRWEWLCEDPQERVHPSFDSQVCSRTLAKDNHRPVVPRPVDQSAVLPPFARDDRPLSLMQECKGPPPPLLPMTFWRNCQEIRNY